MASDNMEKARARRAEVLDAASPRERGREKELEALRWVYRWGWSTPSIVDSVASPNRRGVARRLVKKGLLAEAETPSGPGILGGARSVVWLTRDGLMLVVSRIEYDGDLLPTPAGYRGIKWAQLRHDIVAQQIAADMLRTGEAIEVETPREIEQELAQTDRRAAKVPDFIFSLRSGERIAYELEWSGKSGRRLDQFILGCAALINPHRVVDRVWIMSPSMAMVTRYQKAITPGADIGIWSKGADGKWYRDNVQQAPDWLAERIHPEHLDITAP